MVKNGENLLFWAAAAPPLVHQSMLLYCCPGCLPSESCQICKTISLVFLVRPKSHSAGCKFLSSRTSRMRLIFCSQAANFPKIHAAIVQASADHHCKLPGLGTVFLLSFVRPLEPFFWNLEFWSKNGKTLLFWAAAAPPLVHQSMLLYYCHVCLPSESCQICKPFL